MPKMTSEEFDELFEDCEIFRLGLVEKYQIVDADHYIDVARAMALAMAFTTQLHLIHHSVDPSGVPRILRILADKIESSGPPEDLEYPEDSE